MDKGAWVRWVDSLSDSDRLYAARAFQFGLRVGSGERRGVLPKNPIMRRAYIIGVRLGRGGVL